MKPITEGQKEKIADAVAGILFAGNKPGQYPEDSVSSLVKEGLQALSDWLVGPKEATPIQARQAKAVNRMRIHRKNKDG